MGVDSGGTVFGFSDRVLAQGDQRDDSLVHVKNSSGNKRILLKHKKSEALGRSITDLVSGHLSLGGILG